MLVLAAAKRWNVDPASCRAQSGEVLHAPTRRRNTYGELAADAARMPVPESVVLKRPQDFKLIGTPAKRLDTASKVNEQLSTVSTFGRWRRSPPPNRPSSATEERG
jgi:isoquinoline 1-oxidoreductase beta subunit